MFGYMKVLSTLLYLLLLHQNGSAEKVCSPGQRLNYNTNECEDCPAGQYSPKSGTHINCKVCSECGKGSETVRKCTSFNDTRCRCRQGFTPVDQLREEICVCRKGSGVQGEICKECYDGFFTDKDDSTCQRWKECKSGIATRGTSTSDTVCKDATEEVTEAPKVYTTLFHTTKISSKATSRPTTSSPTKKPDGVYIFWLVMLCAGILLMAGLLYSKCKVTRCVHNFKKVDSQKEGVCRKPIEESGEKCLSLLV